MAILNWRDKAAYVSAPPLTTQSASLSSGDTYSTAIKVYPGQAGFILSGTWTANVYAYFCATADGTYVAANETAITANGGHTVDIPFDGYLKVGIPAAGWTSGTTTIIVGQGSNG